MAISEFQYKAKGRVQTHCSVDSVLAWLKMMDGGTTKELLRKKKINEFEKKIDKNDPKIQGKCEIEKMNRLF